MIGAAASSSCRQASPATKRMRNVLAALCEQQGYNETVVSCPNGTMLNAEINATTDIKLPSFKTPLSEPEQLS